MITEVYRPMCDFGFMANWDGFRPFKDLSAKTAELASLVFLGLPPGMRNRSEFILTWWGLSSSPSNLNPFLDIALTEFSNSYHKGLEKEEGMCMLLFLSLS